MVIGTCESTVGFQSTQVTVVRPVRSIGLASINDWDSEKRQPKDTIVGDLPPELTRGTAAFAVMSLNVAGVSKKGHTFPDFTEAEVEAQSNDSVEA